MKLYVVTKSDETVAVLDNSLSNALHYFNDEFHRYLESGASTFDLSIVKPHAMYSNGADGTKDDYQYLKANHFLIFNYKNKDYKFTIRRVEETETSIRLFCEDLSFDLLNEYRGPYIADKAYNIAKYVNDCLYDSGYTIGINEFAKNARTLKWDGDDTVLKRLLSICNSFDAELEFETQLNNDRTVNKQLVHLRKRVGLNRPDIELKYGREVSSIRRNVDLTELITAIKPRGHENDGKYVTIKNIAKEVKDADGNVAYFTKKGSEYLYAPMANQEYGQPQNKNGGYIFGQLSFDTTSDTELYNRALTELKKRCVPSYEYEIEGYYDVNIGDTIRAIDEAYNPILILEARVSEQIISFSDPSKNKTMYSNYKILQNQVSQSLLDRIDAIKDYADQVAKTYIFSMNNTGSPMFKNGIGEVTYTAKAEKNNKDVTSEFDSFNWTKQLKDGTPDEAWNALHVDFGTTLTVTPDDFEDTATFSYVALKGEETFGGASGVVTKVYDGENGKTPIKGVDYFDGQNGTDGRSAYLHIRYSQNANGTPMTDDPVGAVYVGMLVSQNPTPSTVPADYDWTLVKGADGIPGETGPDGKTSYLHIKYSDDGGKTFTANNGEAVGQWLGQYVDFTQADSTDVSKYAWSKIKGEDGKDGIAGKDGVGLKSTAIQYAQSASGTTAPTTGWTNSVPTLVKGQYLWTKTVWTYTDNSSETGYTVSYNAKDGNNGTDGIAGKDGVGISNTTITYAASTSGTTAPTSGWSTTVPTVAAGAFLWTKTVWTYTDSTTETGYSVAKMGEKGSDGKNGADGSDGKDGVGIASTAITYQASSDGTTAPTGPWLTTIPTVAANQYLWTRTVITYTNNTNSTAYSVGKMGAQGPKGDTGATGHQGPQGPTGPKGDRGIMGVAYMQPTQPNDTTEGTTWFQTESSTSDKIIAVYTYKSGWQKKKYASATLAVESLDALSADLGEITAGIINGVEIRGDGLYSDFDVNADPGGTNRITGRLSMANGKFRNDYKYKYGSGTVYRNGFMQLTQEALSMIDSTGSQTTTAEWFMQLTPTGLTMQNKQGQGGTLTFQDLYSLKKTSLMPTSGYSQYSNNQSSANHPTATRVGRLVNLAGAFTNNAQKDSSATEEQMGTLPVGFRPAQDQRFVAQGSSMNRFLLVITADGKIMQARYGNSASYGTIAAGSWLNIVCTYSAADV